MPDSLLSLFLCLFLFPARFLELHHILSFLASWWSLPRPKLHLAPPPAVSSVCAIDFLRDATARERAHSGLVRPLAGHSHVSWARRRDEGNKSFSHWGVTTRVQRRKITYSFHTGGERGGRYKSQPRGQFRLDLAKSLGSWKSSWATDCWILPFG